MPDLHLASVEEICAELRSRNLSFLITWVDHNEFHKSPDEGIVWGCEGGGNLALQKTCLGFLREWVRQIEAHRTNPYPRAEES